MCRGKGREGVRCAIEVEIDGLSVQERDIPRNKTTNIIVMVFSEDDNTSKLSIFICIAEHFLRSRITRLDNLPV